MGQRPWPAQLTEVFERSVTADFATLTRARRRLAPRLRTEAARRSHPVPKVRFP
ncbi:MAG TPA: hypothetical protein VMU09_06015 [Acidimicrobiales bacterium]|nr:hypothetical protein [Acidimicrobiales bacterium]